MSDTLSPVETLNFGDLLTQSPANLIGIEELIQSTNEIISTLKPIQQKVIIEMFGLVDGVEKNEKEVGRLLKIRTYRVKQLLSRSLRELRHPSRTRRLTAFLTNPTQEVPVEKIQEALDNPFKNTSLETKLYYEPKTPALDITKPATDNQVAAVAQASGAMILPEFTEIAKEALQTVVENEMSNDDAEEYVQQNHPGLWELIKQLAGHKFVINLSQLVGALTFTMFFSLNVNVYIYNNQVHLSNQEQIAPAVCVSQPTKTEEKPSESKTQINITIDQSTHVTNNYSTTQVINQSKKVSKTRISVKNSKSVINKPAAQIEKSSEPVAEMKKESAHKPIIPCKED